MHVIYISNEESPRQPVFWDKAQVNNSQTLTTISITRIHFHIHIKTSSHSRITTKLLKTKSPKRYGIHLGVRESLEKSEEVVLLCESEVTTHGFVCRICHVPK